jgi:hydroxymethylbilane synthase
MKIRIGSRGSALASWQAEHVRCRLEALGHEASIRVIVTLGDRVQDRPLDGVGGKGAFLKEIEEALLAGEVDLGVHSLKDVPHTLPPGLVLAAILPREDPRDALVSSGAGLMGLPDGAAVGTSSLRRRAQIKALRPGLEVLDLRGNVDTRLRKLRSGAYAAIVLALAGLRRLGREAEATEILDPSVILPAPGQGAIALECRADDHSVRAALEHLDDGGTARCVTAERAFLSALGGGCNVPLGALAEPSGSLLRLRGLVASPDGQTVLRGERMGEEPLALGRALGEDLLARGARALLSP